MRAVIDTRARPTVPLNMDNIAIAEQFIAAIDAEDTDTMRQLYAEDAKIWHDFDRKEQDPETNIQSLITLRKAIPSVRWVTTRIEPLPQGFLLTYELTMTLKARELKIPACVIGSVTDGSITRLEEWINAAPMMKYLDSGQLEILAG